MEKKSLSNLPQIQQEELFSILAARFAKHTSRHPNIKWADVEQRLKNNPKKVAILLEMERTAGEPDVVAADPITGALVFVDCSIESPSARRSFCYDREALNARKTHKPGNSVMDCVAEIGAQLLTQEQYSELQQLGEFDNKTSSWVDTPQAIRDKGGAIFCDRRYGQVFTYHNGADSYYASRGFRTSLKV